MGLEKLLKPKHGGKGRAAERNFRDNFRKRLGYRANIVIIASTRRATKLS